MRYNLSLFYEKVFCEKAGLLHGRSYQKQVFIIFVIDPTATDNFCDNYKVKGKFFAKQIFLKFRVPPGHFFCDFAKFALPLDNF